MFFAYFFERVRCRLRGPNSLQELKYCNVYGALLGSCLAWTLDRQIALEGAHVFAPD